MNFHRFVVCYSLSALNLSDSAFGVFTYDEVVIIEVFLSLVRLLNIVIFLFIVLCIPRFKYQSTVC